MTTPKVHSYAAAIATLAARQASAAAAAARSHVEKVIGVSYVTAARDTVAAYTVAIDAVLAAARDAYATACREADDGLAIDAARDAADAARDAHDAARTAHADAYMYAYDAYVAALVAELAADAAADAAAIAVAGEEEGAS